MPRRLCTLDGPNHDSRWGHHEGASYTPFTYQKPYIAKLKVGIRDEFSPSDRELLFKYRDA